MDWEAAPWIIRWIIGMGVICYLERFGPGGIIGGIGLFKHVLDQGGTDRLRWARRAVTGRSSSRACSA